MVRMSNVSPYVGRQGFAEINYKGKPVKRGFVATSVLTLVMCKNDPNRLDMRYKSNRKFVEQSRQSRKEFKND